MSESYLDSHSTDMCCGCSACKDICPKDAISFEMASDLSDYPLVDKEKCINCGLCRKVCPLSSKKEVLASDNRIAYAAQLKNENLRVDSSSGGAFEGIAGEFEKMFPDGLVAGAMWDDNLTVHHALLPLKDRGLFKKSKYVQSNCSGIYKEVKEALSKGKNVLFTGTPCEIAALKSFLGTSYNNLLLVDIVCHGNAGAGILQKYISDLERKERKTVKQIQFRFKKKDFFGEIHSQNICVAFADNSKYIADRESDSYLRGFHKGLFYRDSCYKCPYAQPKREGDLTIGDYWHIQKIDSKLVDYTGVSCIIVNTENGMMFLEKCESLILKQTSLVFLLDHNGQLKEPSKLPKERELFFSKMKNGEDFEKIIDLCYGKPKRFKRFLAQFIPGEYKRLIKGKLKWIVKH